MKTQEILNRINALKTESPVNAHAIYDALVRDLEQQLRLEAASNSGTLNATKVLTKILQSAKKNGTREFLAYPWIDKQGRQCISDGFQAYRLNTPLPLIERPAGMEDGIDLSKIIPADLTGMKPLTMPSAKEIRAEIAVQRSRYTGKRGYFTPMWDFGPDAPVVNAEFLLNAATIFPNAAQIFWTTTVSPLVIRCDEGDGVVLPIRTNRKANPEQQSEEARKAAEAEQARKAAEEAQRKADELIVNANRAVNNALDDWRDAKLRLDVAKDDATKESATNEILVAKKSTGKALIHKHSVLSDLDPDYSIELDDLAGILDMLYNESVA